MRSERRGQNDKIALPYVIKKFFKKSWRAIRRTIRVFFRVIVFFVLLIVLGTASVVVGVHYLVPPDALKTIITAQLQEAFHRPVVIQDVNFNIVQGIRVKGLQIQENADFGGGNVLVSDYIVAKYDWKELVRGIDLNELIKLRDFQQAVKRLDFQQFTITAPHIQIVRNADGRWNWEDILVSSATVRATSEAKVALPVPLSAHVISIQHGVVDVKDLRRQKATTLQSVDLTVHDFSVEKPFAVVAAFENVQQFDRRVRTRMSLKGVVSLAGLQLDEAKFRTEDIAVQTGGKTAHASISVLGFHHPRIEAVLRLPAMDSTFLSQYHAVPEGITAPQSRWRARLSLPEEGRLQVDSLTGTAGGLKLQANGTLSVSKESKAFHLSWNIPVSPLAEVVALWTGLRKYDLSGRAAMSGDLVGDLVDPEHTLAVQQTALNLQDFGGLFLRDQRLAHVDAWLAGTRNFETLSVAATRGAWTAFGNTFTGIDFAASIGHGDLSVSRFNGRWGDSRFKLVGRIQRLTNPKDVHIEGTIDKLDLDKGIQAFLDLLEQLKARHPKPESRAGRMWSQIFKYSIPKSFPATSGHIKVAEISYPAFRSSNLDAQWDLRGISTGLKRSNGNIRISVGPGRVSDIQALEEQDPHNVLRVLFLPFTLMHEMERKAAFSAATAVPRSFDFSRIYGDYGVRKGVVDFRNFYIDSGDFMAHTEGSVDFPKERMNLHVLTRINKTGGALSEHMSDQCGHPAASFFVDDDLNKPNSFKIDFQQMACDAIDKAIQEGMRRGSGIFTAKGGG